MKHLYHITNSFFCSQWVCLIGSAKAQYYFKEAEKINRGYYPRRKETEEVRIDLPKNSGARMPNSNSVTNI
jgi:hypothetical protein